MFMFTSNHTIISYPVCIYIDHSSQYTTCYSEEAADAPSKLVAAGSGGQMPTKSA